MIHFFKNIIILLICLVLSGCNLFGSKVEEPAYKVVKKQGNIEHRRYPASLVAETVVKGERKQALNDGFRIIADFIFGNNKAKQEIAMTAPVEGEQLSQNIAMTAPVDQQKADNDSWVVRFYMPKEYSLETLPTPLDKRVQVNVLPEREFVVIVFSGMNTDSNVSKHLAKLEQYIKRNGLAVEPPPKYAFYNPPWTLPPFKRNEIMYKLSNV